MKKGDREGNEGWCSMMGDDSLRYCKAHLRRRLANGPPIRERESGRAGRSEGTGGPDVSNWGHLWPSGRQIQCEELRGVRNTRGRCPDFEGSRLFSFHHFSNIF